MNKVFTIMIKIILVIFYFIFLLFIGLRNIQIRLKFYETIYDKVISSVELEYPKVGIKKHTDLVFVPFDSIGLGIEVKNLYYPSYIPETESTPDKNRLSRIIRDYVVKFIPRSTQYAPGISNDDEEAINSVISEKRLKLLNKDFPQKPLCFTKRAIPDRNSTEDNITKFIDLKHLFLRSPFIDTICDFLTETSSGYKIDFEWLSKYQVQTGLIPIQCSVELDELFNVTKINTINGSFEPDNLWAQKIVTCCLINVSTLKHHFTYSHHSLPNNLAIATYKTLEPDHYIRRLLTPHVYKTLNTNRALGPTLFVKNGVVSNIFVYGSETCWKILEDVQNDFRIEKVDPMIYLNKILMDSPTKDNLIESYEIIKGYVKEYMEHYFTDMESIGEFVSILKQYVWDTEYNLENLIRILSICIWTGSVRHSFISGNIWDYAAWSHYIPTRMYYDDRNIPIDRYQQTMNTLSIANIPSHELSHNYSYLALDSTGKTIMEKFRNNLLKMDEKYQQMIDDGEIFEYEIIKSSSIGASTAT